MCSLWTVEFMLSHDYVKSVNKRDHYRCCQAEISAWLCLPVCLQVLCVAAAKGEMGGAGGAWPERKGGAKPRVPEESATTARESTAKNRTGQVLFFLSTVTVSLSVAKV